MWFLWALLNLHTFKFQAEPFLITGDTYFDLLSNFYTTIEIIYDTIVKHWSTFLFGFSPKTLQACCTFTHVETINLFTIDLIIITMIVYILTKY